MLAELGGPRYHLDVEELSGVAVPALVVAGTTSLPALRSIAQVLHRGLPDARLVELHGCGHVTYAERPDEFARAVAAFAAELRPTASARPGDVADGTTGAPQSSIAW